MVESLGGGLVGGFQCKSWRTGSYRVDIWGWEGRIMVRLVEIRDVTC